MTNRRIATTITNVKDGTRGANAPHVMAVLDLIAALGVQLREARDNGELGYSDYEDLKNLQWQLDKKLHPIFMERMVP